MANSYLETKIAINQFFLIAIAILLAVGFTAGAFAIGQWAWLVAVPMNAAGIALVVQGASERRRTDGARGTARSTVGALLIVGSIWAAFMLGNAFPV